MATKTSSHSSHNLPLTLLACLLVTIGLLLLASLPVRVYAAQITNFSIRLERINESSNTNHTLFAVLPSGISAGNALSFNYPDDYVVGIDFDFNDMQLAAGNSANCDTASFTAKTIAATPSGATWGAAVNAGNIFTFTSGTDTIASNLCVRVQLISSTGNHTLQNPSVTSNTSYVTTLTANILDSAQAAYIILNDTATPDADQVEILATIAPSITLDIDVSPTNCQNSTETTTTGNIVDLGSLLPNQVSVSSTGVNFICIDLATSAASGVRLLVHSNFGAATGALNGPGDTIPSASANLSSGAVASGYGLRVFSLGLTDIGTLTAAAPFNSVTQADVGQVPGATGTPGLIASSSAPVKTNESNRLAIEVAAKSKTSNAAGQYTDVITFLAIVNF